MKLKKLLAFILAASMTTALVACGNANTVSDNAAAISDEATAPAAQTTLAGASIDFEDGNSAFITEASALKEGDPSTLTVEEIDGNKVLTTSNVFGKNSVFIGFDMEALLGEKIADVSVIQFDAGVLGETFNAVSGEVYAYVGEENKEKELGTYSVYLDTDNPKTVTLNMTDSFVAGCGNYLIISKESDAGTTPTEIMLDNIGFYDAEGNLIEADTTVSVASTSPLKQTGDKKAGPQYGTTVAMEGAYAGDWAQAATIPANVFEGMDGNVNVTVNYKLESDYEYYLIAPILNVDGMPKLTAEDYVDIAPASEGNLYHLQDDGFIVIDDWALEEISFTLTKDAVAKVIENNGLTFQVYGVTASSAVVSDDTYKLSMKGSYGGDWGQDGVIPATLFADAAEANKNVNVTLNFALESGYEYYLIAPVGNTTGWPKLAAEDFVDLAPASEGIKYHLQDDCFIVIDDWAIDTLSFTVNSEAAAKIAGNGGLTFQVYGVTVKNALVSTETFTLGMKGSYGGDWGQDGVIPAALFENPDDNVNVTLNMHTEPGFDYYLIAPVGNTTGWPKLTAEDFVDLAPAKEGIKYHLQDDCFIVVDDPTITTLSFTITKEAAEKMVGKDGMTFQVYGVVVDSATISDKAYTVGMRNEYGGDWGQDGVIPASMFEGATSNVNIKIDFALEQGKEYYLIAPIRNTTGWPKFAEEDFADMVVAEEGVTYHLQKDGFLPIDDWAITSLSFTLAPSGVEKAIKDGGLTFQVYGVTVKDAVIVK